jgi:maltooligosyltrehalose trehalohydrolase
MNSRDAAWRPSFGATPEGGGVRFRVWAPEAKSVDVVLYGPSAEKVQPLDREVEGYFSRLVEGAGSGARYRYRLDGAESYPDPASRSQPEGVHGPSEVVDPREYSWRDEAWSGVALGELVVYELHVGTFTPSGTFSGVRDRLEHVADLGITAIELMPVANFPGARNWGYDGVNLFAPATAYGGAQELKSLIDAAHRAGLGVILDVVYNHFGPEGNYIPAITGGRFLTERHHTPWGAAVNFDGPGSRAVRDFVIENALHWIHEYHVDGLRLDATHTILDDSETHILAELAERVHSVPGRTRLLIAEDERNERRLLLPTSEGGYGLDAVWADDLHHQLRRAAAGDAEGYFARYTGSTADIATTLREGWWRRGGEDSATSHAERLEPQRFVHCIQNHDQVGNRAMGERLNHEVEPSVYRALSALLLIAPATPLLWMGQEWAASTPFLYFTDHPEELGRLVTEGRGKEFEHFSAFTNPALRNAIPDPQAPETFLESKLVWEEIGRPDHAGILELYRTLLRLRRTHPALEAQAAPHFEVLELSAGAIALRRSSTGEEEVLLVANLKGEIRIDLQEREVTRPPEDLLWKPVLSTEEARFGGSGGWGTIEPEGMLHLMGPGAVLLESG